MGRRRSGPIRKGGSPTWYARLTVHPSLRARAGKTRLIRTLGTTNHSVALRRYGEVYAALEKELEELLKGTNLRQRVELWQGEGEVHPWYDELTGYITPTDRFEGALGERFDSNNKQHVEVAEAIYKQTELGVSWEELVELYVKARNRELEEPLSANTKKQLHYSIQSFKKYSSPATVTKQHVWSWLEDEEKRIATTSLAPRFRYLRSLLDFGISIDKVVHNPFSQIKYEAKTDKSKKKRPFTDEELVLVYKHHYPCFILACTGMRPSELASRLPQDVDGDMLIIDKQPSIDWRPKNNASYRRVPWFNGIELGYNRKVNSSVARWCRDLREIIEDPRCTPHSGRHTFMSLSRRAECLERTTDAIAGHAGRDARTNRQYGDFPDVARKREIEKIWALVKTITGSETLLRPS